MRTSDAVSGTVRPHLLPRTTRTRAALVAVALAVSAVGVAAAPAPVAYGALRCTSGVSGDVNGDGHAEVAISEPGNHRGAGSVHVLYGTAAGLVAGPSGRALDDQYVDQDTAGIPGSSAAGNAFGATTAFGDFNGDGCADLAIGAPGENRSSGSVTVLYGSPSGLQTTGVQRRAGIGGERLGLALAAGSFTRRGFDDLAISNLNPKTYEGRVNVHFGDPTGVFSDDEDVFYDTVYGDNSGVNTRLIGFGAGLAAGDFNGDGEDELVIAQSAADDDGQVVVLRGTVDGFVKVTALKLSTRGVPRTPDGQRYTGFGRVTAVGDVNEDGRDDLAVGVSEPYCGSRCKPGAAPTTTKADGAVAVFRGSAKGLSATGAQLWTQDSAGVTGAGADEGFGAALAMGRLDAGTSDDLVVGVPNDDFGGKNSSGSVTVLLGSRTGLTTAGVGGARFGQGVGGISGSPERNDHFGAAVAAVDLRGAAPAAVVVGVPGESLGSITGAGQIHQLAMSAAGPKGAGSRTFSASTAGVQGVADRGDAFGATLS